MPADRADFPPVLEDDRPTSARYLVVGLATLMAVLLYLDRFCLSFLVTYIVEDLALESWQVGPLLSVFFWSYALGQVPSGWLTDRFGARLMLTLYIVLWSVFTGVMGLAFGFVAVLLLRFGCGLAQAGAYPTGASMISKWVPFSGRGRASSVVSVGGRVGGFLAPLLTAYLLVAFVPAAVPSLLAENDLLNPDKLLNTLKEKGSTPSADVARAVRELAPESFAYLQTRSPEMRRGLLVQTLNEVLQQRELYEKADLKQFNLPSEAWQLADIPAGELTSDQITRRNRLLLEAAFPDALRKIYGHGWRPVAIVYGLAGLVVAGFFWLGVRDRPREHPGCNAAEVSLIEHGRPAHSNPHGRVAGLPLKYLIRSRSLWCSSVSQFGTNFGWAFLLLMLPLYLDQVHRVPPIERGWMASLPVLVGMAGMLGGGWLTDRLTRALGVRWGRGLPMAATRFMAMSAYLICLGLADPWLLTAAFCLVAFSTDLGTASVWAFKQDVGGRYVGSVLGWGNMWGNFGAAISPLVLTAIVGEFQWEYRFLACAFAFFVAGIAALGVDARIPIAPPDEE